MSKAGTRCPHCAFWNDYEATASAIADGPIYCNACGRVYESLEMDDPVAFLESARIEWRRDWDAVAIGYALGALSVLIAQVIW